MDRIKELETELAKGKKGTKDKSKDGNKEEA
jgi:hypothetical protein